MGDGRRIGMRGGFVSGGFFLLPDFGVLRKRHAGLRVEVGPLPERLSGIGAQVVPGGQIVSLQQAPEEAADVGVVLWIGLQDRIIYVPRLLSPRIEDDFFIGMVGMQGGDDAFNRVVEQDRRDAGHGHLWLFFIKVCAAEEGLVLFDGLPFVIIDRTPFSHPAVIGMDQFWLAVFQH